MKIPELAKKLSLNPTLLRKKLTELGYDLGKKTKSVRDDMAEEIIQKIQAENEAEKAKAEKQEKAKEKKVIKEKAKSVELGEVITVKNFAAKLEYPVTELMTTLIKNGIMATINENIDFETASIIAEDLGFKVKKAADSDEIEIETKKTDEKELKVKPPVVTIIGHVDHGKTSLLDKIREEKVAESESGGITQAISSYQVEIDYKKDKRKITFIDTPGHEAFAAMRAHGVKITDLAVLVVAADDGVKPQTIEAANFAKAAGVPILVAINKIDKPGADVNKVKKGLSEIGLSTEDWGGSTVAVEVSAKTGQGIEEMLEMILTVADLDPQKAAYSGLAAGVVVESHMDPRVGATATVLIQKGELKNGDRVVVGVVEGKIRRLLNDRGESIKSAFPSEPAQIIGLTSVPKFGDTLFAFSSDKIARKYLNNILQKQSAKSLVKSAVGIGEIAEGVKEGKIKELNVIIRADVTGSAEAIKDSLEALGEKDIKINVLVSGVGKVTDKDISQAEATGALVLAFKTSVSPNAQKLAKESNVKVATYDVIYQLLDDVTLALEGLLEPEIVEEKVGKAKILAIFRTTKTHKIIGCKLNSGFAEKDLKVLIFRDKTKIGEGKVESLQKAKDSVSRLEAETECGIGLDTNDSIEIGDKLTFIKLEEKLRKLKR